MEILHDTQQTLEEVLAGCGARSVKQFGESRWKLSFSNGKAFGVIAVADEEWLSMEVQPPSGGGRPTGPEPLWDCLEWNAGLPGGVKFALGPQDRCPRIRAELPLEDGINPAEAVRLAVGGLKAAFHRLGDGAGADEPQRACAAAEPDAAGAAAGEAKVPDLADLCTSAGWQFNRRASGHLAVELETLAPSCQAVVEPRRRGLTAAVQLASCEGLGPESRRAAAMMLLTACGMVRMVRAIAARADGRTVLGYEVAMEPSPTPAQLGRGLSALSVACSLCGPQEMAALQDGAVAKRYLAARGCSS
jgi:hypothetical protein